MTNNQLQLLVQHISLKYFSRPFTNRAYFNYRLRTTGGRFHLRSHDIDINPKMLTDFGQTTLVKVIKHELCHYHLYNAGYRGDHGPRFMWLLRKVGGSRYAPAPKKTCWIEYQCERCGKLYFRRRRINTHRYVCSKDFGRLKFVGTTVK